MRKVPCAKKKEKYLKNKKAICPRCLHRPLEKKQKKQKKQNKRNKRNKTNTRCKEEHGDAFPGAEACEKAARGALRASTEDAECTEAQHAAGEDAACRWRSLAFLAPLVTWLLA